MRDPRGSGCHPSRQSKLRCPAARLPHPGSWRHFLTQWPTVPLYHMLLPQACAVAWKFSGVPLHCPYLIRAEVSSLPCPQKNGCVSLHLEQNTLLSHWLSFLMIHTERREWGPFLPCPPVTLPTNDPASPASSHAHFFWGQECLFSVPSQIYWLSHSVSIYLGA